MFSLEAI